MPAFAVTAPIHHAFDAGMVLTALGFGFRHGIDWDHIAALTDITASQDAPRRSIWFATLYAFGHALVVFILGVAAIVLSARLPPNVDRVTERFVGATLIILAVYVFSALALRGRRFRMRSRVTLLINSARRAMRWFASDGRGERVPVPPTSSPDDHSHAHWRSKTDSPFLRYSCRGAFVIGMIHGIGAETPTQVLIFLSAAGVGGSGTGLILLVCFVVGLLTANTAVAAAGTAGYVSASRDFRLYAAVSLVTACVSAAIGVIFLTGNATTLPALFGG
jgi:high-affinity nickel-transport protein